MQAVITHLSALCELFETFLAQASQVKHHSRYHQQLACAFEAVTSRMIEEVQSCKAQYEQLSVSSEIGRLESELAFYKAEHQRLSFENQSCRAQLASRKKQLDRALGDWTL
jgi:hypothetical protein